MAGEPHGGEGIGRYIGIGRLLYSPAATLNPSRGALKRKDSVWRPFTLRPPTLLLFLFTTIGLIATIEALNHISTRNGALTFADYSSGFSPTDPSSGFSVAQIFCYRYLPQLVIVLYGIGWAAVDLDVKRLEPYFQLSEPGGASASDSILLHYPFDFLALVPITAAKRRHWRVFAAGTALVLIFWVITPLQSSLLAIKPVPREIRELVTLRARLEDFSSQAEKLDSSFLDSAYGVTWLGEELTKFMTREFVAMPIQVGPTGDADDRYYFYGLASMTAVTRVYQTHIDCVPATVNGPGENGDGAYNFTTDNCFYRFDPLPNENATRNLIYIGHGSINGTAERHLHESECTVKNIFLGVWAKSRLPSSRSTDIEVSGVFCHTKYSYSDADITAMVFGSWGNDSVRFIGEPKLLTTEDKIIDIDLFEQYLGAGSTMESYNAFRVPNMALAPQIRYEDWGLWDPERQVGYAIGLENTTFDAFRDPKVFGDAMNKTHKLLFNYAVRYLVDESDYEFINGTMTVQQNGVVVVSTVAHLLAGFLLLVAICLTGGLILLCSRCNNLRSDPDTLATKMSLVARSPQFLRDFEGADNCSDISKGMVERRRYKLGPWDGEVGNRLDILDAADVTPSEGSQESSTTPDDGRGVRPWELSVGMGVGTTIFSAGLLVLLSVLFWSSQRYSGLPTLSSRDLAVRFIWSFIPTVAATLIEPVWVVVTRYLALYQPWTELNKGRSSSATSLGLKYTNLPPALIAPRALASRHYILCLASAVVLASNGLAVALGGLFDTSVQSINTTVTVEFPLSTSIDTQIPVKGSAIKTTLADVSGTFAKDGEEHWLTAKTFWTVDAYLPLWIGTSFYFLPFEWNRTVGSAPDYTAARTWGIGMSPTCELLEGGVYGQQSWAGVSGGSAPKPAVALNVTIPTADGGVIRCNNSLVEFTVDSLKTGRFAGEYLYGLGPTDRADKEAEDFCNSLLVVGWSRGEITVAERNDSTASYTMDMGTYANTTILCMQRIASAEFEVFMSDVRRFGSPERLTPLTYDDSSFFNHSTTITSFKSQLSTIIRTNPFNGRDRGGMHNDIFPNTLPHYLMDLSRSENGQKTLSLPDTPPPSFEDAQKTFQKFYSLIAAIVIGQNSERIFRSTTKDGGKKPQTTGRISSEQSRVSMDPVMFYIAAALLGFSTIASVVIFTARPKRFLPRLPNTLAAEIGFFYASEALKDTAGTASMSSAIRERHLAKLGWRYGYGKFTGTDGKVHLGVERMGPIDDFKEAS